MRAQSALIPSRPATVCRGMAVVWDCEATIRGVLISSMGRLVFKRQRRTNSVVPRVRSGAGPRRRHPEAHTVTHHTNKNLTNTTHDQQSTNKKPARITPLRALAVQAAINQTSTSAQSTADLKQLITGCQRARRCQQRLGRYRYTSSPCRTCRQCDADRAPRLQRGWHRLRPGGGPER